jgi:curved DNA-binding protein CbpA
MCNIETIKEACALLCLRESASVRDIKKAYLKLALKYHPDKCKEKHKKGCEEKFKEILNAKDFLIDYCENYPIPLDKEIWKEETEDDDLLAHYQQFYSGWFGDFKK